MSLKSPQPQLLRVLVITTAAFGLAVATMIAVDTWPWSDAQRASMIVGMSLPPSVSHILVSKRAGMFGGDYYVSAVMPREDYRGLVTRLGLRHRPDLLDYWPTALSAQDTPWWTVSTINDADTYFGDSEKSTYIVTRYEGGRIYFKRHAY